MEKRIYLDYNASTPLDPRVAAEIADKMALFGNPSSIHAEGRQARALIDQARVSVAGLLNADHHQVIFTSGGTEANNLAIFGTAAVLREKGKHLITSAIEHSSVLNCFRQLEKEGFDVDYLPPTASGMVDPQQVEDAIREETILISIMLANNEVGTVQSIHGISSLARSRGICLHTDAVQALGKIPVDVESLGADLVSVSAHKIYGPRGVGALYHSADTVLTPLLRGGSHEKGFRAGTENVHGIHGFGCAARLILEEGIPDFLPLRTHLEEGLGHTHEIVCREAKRLPNTVNFFSRDWLGESLVMALDLEGISISNGSACSSGIIEPSHVILALGYNESIARSVIRVSFGKFTTCEDVDCFLDALHRIEGAG